MSKYREVTVEGVAALAREDWERVCDPDRNVFMDPRFLAVLERGLGKEYRQWMTLLYDGERPIAAACFSRMIVDGAMFAPAGVRRGIERIRKVWPSFLKFKLLVGGLPISTGQPEGQIATAPEAEMAEVTRLLDATAVRLAKESGAKFITIKEFAPEMMERLKGLSALGYQKCSSVVTHTLELEQGTFEEYYEARSKRTRANMRKVFAKLEASGLEVVALQGEEAAARFTPEMHRLYEAVFDRSEAKFEYMPLEFFQELARGFPRDAYFTYLSQGGKPVAFCCAVASARQHNMLYCGIDYALNPEADLYFNTLYKGLAQGFREGVERIKVGAAADEFKKRLGCTQTPLGFYVKVIGRVPGFCFRLAAPLLFPPTGVGNADSGDQAGARQGGTDGNGD